MKKVALNVFLVVIFLQFLSCRRVDDQQSDKSTFEVKVEKNVVTNDKRIYYRFPSPNKMVQHINESDLLFIKSNLSSTENTDNYIEYHAQALNLGIYVADLAYIMLFDNLKLASEYFKTVEDLSYKINISSVFDEELKSRIKKNASNLDSLAVISKDTYNDIIQYLINTDNEKTLVIISAGAYVETLYLALMQVENFSKNYGIIENVFKQKYALENLIQYMEQFDSDDQLIRLSKDLRSIQEILHSAPVKKRSETKVEKKDGMLVFSGGGEDLDVKKTHFKQLREEIIRLRKKYTAH
jgi:hypothetical protein